MIQLVVGGQWGDEGKGKVVDLMAEKADLVVRFHGGNNADIRLSSMVKKYAFSFNSFRDSSEKTGCHHCRRCCH